MILFMKTFLQSLRVLSVLTLITGALYPLAVWGVGQVFFRDAAEGSLLRRDGQIVGSALLAQKTDDARYFHPRRSAGDYATVATGASNQAWSNAKLAAAVAARQAAHGENVSAEFLTASGSGLDPDLSPGAVRGQTDRVAVARNLTPAQRTALDELIAQHTHGGQFSVSRINVLQLNLALDTAFPSP